jgi:hypothetical protein
LEQQLWTRAQEILNARKDLNSWARTCSFEPAQHHRVINDRLMRLERREGKRRVMFQMPPGSAKSTYASMLFPPWFMSRNPKLSVLAASHSEELAERFSGRVKSLILEHGTTLGIATAGTTGMWRILPVVEGDRPEQMGEYLAAGAGSAIAGFRGDLGIIDDAVRGREEVASEVQRQKLWDWYVFDFRPRLKPNARQVVIGTRWHEDDLQGRILQESGDEWDVISIPMVAESFDDALGRDIGDLLWPEWFNADMVAEAQRDPLLWNSLYQQRPTAEMGDYWRREWLHAIDPRHVPPRDTMRVYGGSDYAVTAGGGDYTVHAVVGLDSDDRPWLLDLWRARTASDFWVAAWCDLVKLWRPMSWAEEAIQITSGIGPWIDRASREKKAYTERIAFPTRGDKGIRAQSMRGIVASRGLWFSTELRERGAIEAELLAFPNGRHDDIHDALGLVGQLLDIAIHGHIKEKPKPKQVSGYKRTGEVKVQSIKVF